MKLLKVTIPVIVASLLIACGSSVFDTPQNVVDLGIKNLRQVEPTVYASGQPSKEQLAQLKVLGVTDVINLRPASEMDWDEAELEAELGMQYHSIPVAGGSDLNNSKAQLLQQKLAELGGQPVLVHCSSGNRIGSLISIDQYMSKNKSIDSAIAEGKRWGLTRNESAVRNILNTMERPQ